MKKFISMVMAAAMVVSLVPATAFAASDNITATAKVVDALELTKDEAKADPKINEANYATKVPELHLKVTNATYRVTNPDAAKMEVTLTLDNANFLTQNTNALRNLVRFDLDTPASDTIDINANGAYLFSPSGSAYVEEVEIATLSALEGYEGAKFLVDHKTGAPLNFQYTAPGKVDIVKGDVTKEVLTAGGAWNATFAPDGDGNDELMAALLNGWTLKYAAGVGLTLNGLAAEVPSNFDMTVAQQVAYLQAQNPTWVRADYVGAGALTVTVNAADVDKDEVTFTINGKLHKDDVIIFDLESVLDKTTEGRTATVSVESDMVTADDLVYVSILGEALKASVKKTVDVAPEETTPLNDKGLKIEAAVGKLPNKITLKTSKGFEFVKSAVASWTEKDGKAFTATWIDDNEVEITGASASSDITLKGIVIEAASAKAGDVATIKVSAKDFDSASVEVAKVVDNKVVMSVDEDEDVPVFYSGVDANNTGLTVDDEHEALEVTLKETFEGAWSMHKDFELSLPEGVYVVDVAAADENGTTKDGTHGYNADEMKAFFAAAYQEGDHESFVFKKRTFAETEPTNTSEVHEITFTLTLVADPDFVGDVTLKLTGDAVDEQEVTIAKFVAPYTVKAAQNDLKIDYRNTAIPTTVEITEAEAGLWEKDAEFTFVIDDNGSDLILFEDGEFVVDENSDLELKKYDNVTDNGAKFVVKAESDDEPATVTLQDMELFMQRNIPAGAYDLGISTTMSVNYEKQGLFAPDVAGHTVWNKDHADKCGKECFIEDVCDYSDVVKEGFINVITAGREVDDASFTTKVVVPVGETKMYSGEKEITLDVPAYINAAGYTMLPVRAVAVALGIDNNAVQWDPATKTVIIMYGQRVITMTAGQKVIYASGTAIPARSAVEIKDGRAFLGLRDLATALGVTTVNYDTATKTATLN